MIRKPAVAGQFYPAKTEDLKKLLSSFSIHEPKKKERAIACLLPHAGLVYSGKVAASVLATIEPAETYIILGPNHTGLGMPYSVSLKGEWLLPSGAVPVDADLAQNLMKRSQFLKEDATAHAYEHSIEVQLPLLREITKRDFSFVPILLASADDLVYKDIASCIAEGIRASRKSVTIIASSDMTHYEEQESANRKDRAAIQTIEDLDEEELIRKIEKLNISMCGYVPAVITIIASKLLGAKEARLISYQTSGETTGDYRSVVGYAGLTIR